MPGQHLDFYNMQTIEQKTTATSQHDAQGNQRMTNLHPPAISKPTPAISEQHKRLVGMLWEWATWMHRGSSREFGRAPIIANGVGSLTFDEWAVNIDYDFMRTIDAAVDDLTYPQASAIRKCYGLARVWRFGPADYLRYLDEAHAKVLAGLRRRGIEV